MIRLKDELLKELQKKYEYLDFNDMRIFMCFEEAYLCMDQDYVKSSSRGIGLLHMEMEHTFLSKMRRLLQKDKDIYDAVFLRMTPYFAFFRRKRADLTSQYKEDMCETLYQLAFSKTVFEASNEFSFRSRLMQNLIEIFRNKMNNIFDFIGTYEEKYFDLLLSILTKDEINLLKRKFGPSFDGKNSLDNLGMLEHKKLGNLLEFMIPYFATLEDTIINKHISYEELVEKLECLPREEHLPFLNKLSVFKDVKKEVLRIEGTKSSKEIETKNTPSHIVKEKPLDKRENIPSSERMTYLDALIYKGYIYFGNMDMVKEQLFISEERLLSSIVNHFYLYENDTTLKEYLFSKDAIQIRKMITFLVQREDILFTEKERDYMYLLACKKQNPLLTDEAIFDLISLTKEDVKEYRPMTKNDFLNELYVYIKK